jgi:hypothetical protein
MILWCPPFLDPQTSVTYNWYISVSETKFASLFVDLPRLSKLVPTLLESKYLLDTSEKLRELVGYKAIQKQEAQGPHRSPESYWLIFRI